MHFVDRYVATCVGRGDSLSPRHFKKNAAGRASYSLVVWFRQVSISGIDEFGWLVKPHLIHGSDPHDGKAQAHQTTCYQYDPGKSTVNFSEIPRAYVCCDTHKRRKYYQALEPDGAQIDVAENESQDKENKCNTEQVDVRYPYQCVDRGACVHCNNGHEIVETIKI